MNREYNNNNYMISDKLEACEKKNLFITSTIEKEKEEERDNIDRTQLFYRD